MASAAKASPGKPPQQHVDFTVEADGAQWPASAMGFTPERREELADLFAVFDQQGKGHILAADLRVAMRMLGVELTREQMQSLGTLYSSDGGKSFTKSEYFEACDEILSSRTDADRENAIEEAFSLFDTSAAGAVGPKELQRVIAQLTREVAAAEAEGSDEVPTFDAPSAEDIAEIIADLGIGDSVLGRNDFIRILTSSGSIV